MTDCLYCGPYTLPDAKLITVKTIDGKEETVCEYHEWAMNGLGLIANGLTVLPEWKELADYIRETITNNRDRIIYRAKEAYEMRSVRDLEDGLWPSEEK